MADVTRRRTGELLRELFVILMGAPSGVQARDALKELETRVKLTEYEAGDYESGGRRFERIVRFSTVDCVKAGWMVKNKGIWSVTEAGKAAFVELTDPEVFYKRATKLYHEWASTRPDADPDTQVEAEDETSGKAARITLEEAEEQAWIEIEQYLRAMKP